MTVRGVAASAGQIVTQPPGVDPTLIGAVPAWVKVGNALSHTLFQTAGTTLAITLFTLPAAGIIHAIKIKQSTAFAGGAITAYTISVGIVGTAAKYAAAFDVFQAVSATAFALTATVGSESHGAGVIIQATAVSTTANTNASTAGVVDIWALLSKAL